MCRARLIVAEIRLVHCDRPIVPQQGAQCHHVSLLDRLGTMQALRPEVGINRHSRTPVCSDVDLFELEVPCKLLEELGSDVETRYQCFRSCAPDLGFLLGETKPHRHPLPLTGLLAVEDVNDIGRTLQVKGRHCVCVCIIIDQFVILVGTDHLPDMGPAVVLDLRPARPEARRLYEDLGTCFQHEGVVASRSPVLPNGVRNVGADVMLSFSRADCNDPAIGQ